MGWSGVVIGLIAGTVLYPVCGFAQSIGSTSATVVAGSNAPLIVVSNITVQTWPEVARRISDLRMQSRLAEEAPYDPNKTGRMDPNRLDDYHRQHAMLLQRERGAVRDFLLRRHDKDGNGELTEVELRVVLDAFRDVDEEAPNSVARKVKRYITQARYVDANGDGLISEAENDVAVDLEEMARQRSSKGSGGAREQEDVAGRRAAGGGDGDPAKDGRR